MRATGERVSPLSCGRLVSSTTRARRYWPHLLREGGFLEQFVTPLIKARKGNKEVQQFFGTHEFERWWRQLVADKPDEVSKWRIKFVAGTCSICQSSSTSFRVLTRHVVWWLCGGRYYKGLGTSTAAEGREYFSNLARHHRTFTWTSPDDDDRIEMAFSKAQVCSRHPGLA